MAYNITPDEVRYAGNGGSTEVPDARLNSAAFIPLGDGWLTEILEANSLTTLAALTSSDANRGALAKAAEIYYVASLVAAEPSKEDFQAGPVTSKSQRTPDKIMGAEYFV